MKSVKRIIRKNVLDDLMFQVYDHLGSSNVWHRVERQVWAPVLTKIGANLTTPIWQQLNEIS